MRIASVLTAVRSFHTTEKVLGGVLLDQHHTVIKWIMLMSRPYANVIYGHYCAHLELMLENRLE